MAAFKRELDIRECAKPVSHFEASFLKNLVIYDIFKNKTMKFANSLEIMNQNSKYAS